MDQQSRWKQSYEALIAFVEREGHSRVPAGHIEGGAVLLGNWVAHQRQQYRRGCLAASRVEMLSALPGWEWGPLSRGPMRDIRRDSEMQRMRSDGLSLQQVADRFGVSRQRVHQIVQRAGASS